MINQFNSKGGGGGGSYGFEHPEGLQTCLRSQKDEHTVSKSSGTLFHVIRQDLSVCLNS